MYNSWMNKTIIVHGHQDMRERDLRARALALIFSKRIQRGLVLPSRIIFSGGKTSDSLASEARLMQDTFLCRLELVLWENRQLWIPKNYPKDLFYIWNDTISMLLEENSCDTLDNAEKSTKLLEWESKYIDITLLSSLSHLPRIAKLYKSLGWKNVKTISAEAVFYDESGLHKTDERYKKYIKKYISRPRVFYRWLQELILYPFVGSRLVQNLIRKRTQQRIKV